MWKDLSTEWQKTFEQAWIAFQHGSIPIGAIITDEAGNVTIYAASLIRTEGQEEPMLGSVETDEEWTRIKNILKEFAKSDNEQQ